MENPMLGNLTRTTICSVVFVDIVGYSKLTVAKQLATKGWFNDLLSQALCNLSPMERIILDTGDGAALSFMNDPEDALFVARSIDNERARSEFLASAQEALGSPRPIATKSRTDPS